LESHDRQNTSDIPAPSLLVLTGASHTGKTSVAEEILRGVGAPTAFLGVDDVLTRTLIYPPGDVWAQISLSYELLLPQVETLLKRGWFVLFESTFTRVSEGGPSEFHGNVLDRLIAVADRCHAPWAVVQLNASADIATSRATDTGRLPPEIVAETVRLHDEAALPNGSARLNSKTSTRNELARRALAAIRAASQT
jgi:AAA domain-containing protein